MPLKSTRSFSGKLLKRYRSKTKLKDETVEPVPALPIILPVLDIGTLNLPFAPSPSQYDSSPLPKPRAHRRSRSFSELLSIASSATGTTTDFAPAQPWRDRDAWAAIHSPTQGPVRSRNDAGSVMDRSYGWMERDPERALNQRDVKGRDQFKFFQNTQNTSSTSLGENTRDIRYPVHASAHAQGRSRLNESTSTSSSHTAIPPPIGTGIGAETRPTSTDDTSSTISSMDLSTNPHTPPTSIDQHFIPPSQPYSNEPDTPQSATSIYSNDDVPLPPLLPHIVKRADSPPAFTSRYPTQVPWAQRSTMRDIREASNLRWATGSGSNSPSPSPSQSPLKPIPVSQAQPPRTPSPLHRRKRSMTAPSVFDNVIKQEQDSRPESGTLPAPVPSPPRPPRHPKRQTRAPPPIPIETEIKMPVAMPYDNPPSSCAATASSRSEWATPLTSPMPLQSPVKVGPSPSAYYKPTMPLRSVGSAQSLRPGNSKRPSTAPTQGSAVIGKSTPIHGTGYPTPPSSSIGRGFDRLSRNTSSSSATRGGWI